MQKIPYLVLIFLLIIVPRTASAEFFISEIMYDLEGGDDGREWIEVENVGSTALDLSTYKFREADTNHALTLIQGEAVVQAGGYALIVDDVQKFLLDHPSISVAVFDSSFSLSNTGETLSIRNASLVDVDSVSYTSATGAAGDGNSLQKNAGSFSPASPTPGAPFSGVVNPPSATTTGNSSSNSANTTSGGSSGTVSPVYPENEITVTAGPDRSVVVGADSIFEAVVYDPQKKPIENVRLIWNFGDGITAEGRKVLHAFRYPGTYVVAVSAAVAKVGISDYVSVTAYEPAIRLLVTLGEDGYAEVENTGVQKLDISLWRLAEGSAFFSFPEGTFILPKSKVRFAHAITHLLGLPALTLLYPNGMPASLLPNVLPVTQIAVVPTASKKTVPTAKSSPPPRKAELAAATLLGEDKNYPAPQTRTTDNFWIRYGWYFALLGLILVGSTGMVFLRRKGETKSLADEFEIVE